MVNRKMVGYRRSVRWGVLALVVSLLGCVTGEIGSRSAPDGSVTLLDGGTGAGDAASRDGSVVADAPAPDGAPPGEDAALGDGGGRDSGPVDPCASVTCGTNERCVSGTCRCVAGTMRVGGTCVAVDPGDPAARAAADVCAQWRAGHVENASPAWTPGATMCDLGTLRAEAIDDTLRRITMFRWLVGLGPVTDDPGQNGQDQACAVMMNANGAISHTPDASWDCYTPEAAAGAGSSNLALGVGSPADAIDLYVSDRGVSSLGHRRWVLYFSLGRVGIGFAGNAQCLGVFDSSGSSSRTWVAWPNPGPTPREATTAVWSFHATASLGGADVTVERASDSMMMPVTVSHPPDGYGASAVAFSPSGWSAVPGETYLVTITGFSGGPVSYPVSPQGC